MANVTLTVSTRFFSLRLVCKTNGEHTCKSGKNKYPPRKIPTSSIIQAHWFSPHIRSNQSGPRCFVFACTPLLSCERKKVDNAGTGTKQNGGGTAHYRFKSRTGK
jgi:hypothetical protein